jgi:hypothetical protein
VSKVFVESKLAEGTAGPHVIKMVAYTQRLEKLGFPLGQELATDFILASLPLNYRNFISNYRMLKIAESDIKKSTGGGYVMAV